MFSRGKRSFAWRTSIGGFAFILLLSSLFAQQDERLLQEIEFFRERAEADLLNAISYPGGRAGTIIASPSQHEPNYRYFWIRDGAHIIHEIVLLYREETNPIKKEFLERLIFDFIRLTREIQLTPNRSGAADAEGLGEPKWHLDGSRFNDHWGRPQDDGPALRARALSVFAQLLLAEGRKEKAKEIYNGDRNGPLKVDLEFVARFYDRTSFEMWEEVMGEHLSTLIQHHRALMTGADLARSLDDLHAADHYEEIAKKIRGLIEAHWSPQTERLVQTLRREAGIDYKTSGLDSGVILAVIDHDERDLLPPWDVRVLKTALAIKMEMLRIHPINQVQRDHHNRPMMPGIGRYPEDQYDGVGFSGGNPWFLTTAAFAELSYQVLSHWLERGEIKLDRDHHQFIRSWIFNPSILDGLKEAQSIAVTDSKFWEIAEALLEAGDGYLRRYLYHSGIHFTPSEQFDSNTGHQRGAERLTWNCAAMLGAIRTRELADKKIKQQQRLQIDRATK